MVIPDRWGRLEAVPWLGDWHMTETIPPPPYVPRSGTMLGIKQGTRLGTRLGTKPNGRPNTKLATGLGTCLQWLSLVFRILRQFMPVYASLRQPAWTV